MFKILTFVICAFIMNTIFSVTFQNLDNKINVSYIYAPGMLTTEPQTAKYCSPFIASTGEIVQCDGIQVMQQPITAVTFDEIVLKKKNTKNPFMKLYYDIFAKSFEKIGGIVVEGDSVSDTSVAAFYIKPWKLNFGQKRDIEILKQIYNKHLEAQKQNAPHKEQVILLYSYSRGTTAAFNFLAQEQPKEVKACVFESAVDSIEHVLFHHFPKITQLPKAVEMISAYKVDGISPIDNVEKIDKNLPMLFITSLADGCVPYECTVNLYATLREKGYEKVYLHVLNNSSHIGYTSDDVNDKESYEKVVHAFWARYNLPHDKALATLGNPILDKCQPTRQELEERIKKRK